ncbi:radical SAM protein [Butyrivibrio sp. AC2005]|uniref:radical SAM protein n=1 Tax=Butyrivibrio sp. AC2005 TaxID=1280672 RepID=UPI00040CC192|nr:radical SAM protein [Butyrivibrio sp. AC2005]
MLESMSDLLEIVAKNEGFYLYGAGLVGRAVASALAEYGASNKMIVAIDARGEKLSPIEGHIVQTVSEVIFEDEYPIIVATRAKFHLDIGKVLQEKNAKNVYYVAEDLSRLLLDKVQPDHVNVMECLRRIMPQPRLSYLVIDILTHCNLNCAGCDHFASISKKNIISAESIISDVNRFAEIMTSGIDRIGIMGGEPLLHPELKEIVRAVRNAFPKARIQLDTNGITLLKQEDEFWEVCRESHIVITNTKYPIDLDFSAMEKKCYDENVEFEYYGNSGEVQKTLYKVPLDITGGQDPRKSFMKCFHANYCVTLMNGKLYPCTIAPNSYIYCEKYGRSLELSENDYIDIYNKNISEKEVLRFLAEPIPFCRYCDIAHRMSGLKWRVSSGEEREWRFTDREKNPKEEFRIRTPRKELKFEVHLTEHCNLNCKGCFHFSSIADQEFLDYEDYKRDCERLSELYNGKASQILLLGGEPLLHPNIEMFIELTRNCFRNCKLTIVTNGILLPDMPDSFWECCAKNKVSIEPTKYPIKVDYDAIEKKANEMGVDISYFNNGNIEKTLVFQPLDVMGRQNKEDNFYGCYRANNCITLKHGRLYTCIMPAHVIHFSKRFNEDLPCFENDGIDIYAANSAEEISEFLTRPIEMCRYCDLLNVKKGLKWEVSRHERSEWA